MLSNSVQRYRRGKSFPISRGQRPNMPWLRIVLALIILYSYGIFLLYSCACTLLGPMGVCPSKEETIQIKPGMSAADIGSLLVGKGLIKSRLLFRLMNTMKGTSRSLKAGEYDLSTEMNVSQILHKISSGEAVTYRLLIPEGFTLSQISGMWAEKGFGESESFIEAASDPAMKEKYGIDSDNFEGYLFPDTYIFSHGVSEREAIDKMLNRFNEKVSNLFDEKVEKTGLSRHEIITLASIIEREAKAEEERPIISAVFHNRLKMGQKLESCATVFYVLGYQSDKLTYKDLENAVSPYNTYIHEGLPPGPICSPSLGSIMAAISPSDDKYLYFVSRNDGTHYFTESYSDFVNAKRKYRDN